MVTPQDRVRGRARSLLLFVASFAVVAAVVGSMFQVFRSGQWALDHAREVLGIETLWNWGQGSAVLALHSYALNGDPAAFDSFEEAIALPRAMRPAFQATWEHPGDGDRVREALEAEPLLEGQAEYWGDWMDRYGARPEALEVARVRIQKDSLLQQIETEAAELRSTVEATDPASPEVQAIVARIRELNLELIQVDRPHFQRLMAQEADAQASMERSMRLSALSLLLGGGILVGLLLLRARRAESSVVESEARFRQMAENVDEVFWLAEADTRRFLYVSPAYASIWGRPVAELYESPNAWLEGVHPDDRDRVRGMWTERSRASFDQEYRVVTPAGEVRRVRNRAFPVTDANGTVVRFAGVAEDITRRKLLENELVQSQKLRSVGRLAGGVAHEFNNLLTVIQGHLLLVLSERDHDEELSHELDEALRATRKAANVTRNLLSFAGSQILRPEQVELARFIRDSEEMIRAMLFEDIDLEMSLEDGVTVDADPSFLNEVLVTLTARGFEAMPQGGTLRIGVELRAHAGSIPVEGGMLPPASWGVLVVEDTGVPICDTVREHLFEPFGPMDDGSEGARLELASVFGIVGQTGGGIRVETVEGDQGTRFSVYLPLREADEPAAPHDSAGVEPTTARVT